MTIGLMGVPEYRELAESLNEAEDRYAELADAVERYVDVEEASFRAIQALDTWAADVLRSVKDR